MQIDIPRPPPPRRRNAQCAVTDREYERLREIAQEHGISVSALIHHLIKQLLGANPNP